MLILATALLIESIQHKCREKAHKQTLKKIPLLGTKLAITGETGVGKTTMAAGICSSLEVYIVELCKKKMERVQTIMDNCDFVYINHFIDQMCEYNYDAKPGLIFDMLNPAISEYIYNGNEHRVYFDGIKVHTYESLIYDYIEARIAFNRDNYVFSNIDYFSWITGAKNFDLDGSDTKIKDRFKDSFRLRRYSAVLYDEETADSEKSNTNWQTIAQLDSGATEFLRLHRHWFKNTSWYIGTMQHGSRMVKEQRELFNAIIHIVKRKRLSEFKVIKFIFKLAKIFNELQHDIFKLITNNNDKLESRKNLYKKRKKFIMNKLDLLSAMDFLAYKVEIYTDTDKEASHSTSRIETTFVFPVIWCFSPIETHEYSYQYDEAVKNSQVSPIVKVDEDTAGKATRYLAKRKKIVKETRINRKLLKGGI